MNDHSQDRLSVLGQLALEYHQKYKELEDFVQNAPHAEVILQLGHRAEISTDHFRAAQQVLFACLSPDDEGECQDAFKALTTLCRSFDEMRILFQITLEEVAEPGVQKRN